MFRVPVFDLYRPEYVAGLGVRSNGDGLLQLF